MKTNLVIFILFIYLLFSISLNAQPVTIQWHTFLGSDSHDYGHDVARDGLGNVYVTGVGDKTWGSPVNAYSGSNDVFVACLDSSGNLLWNTFLGSSEYDWSNAISVDGSGNVYVIGWSIASWGSPLNAFNGGYDVFVACLDSSGNLSWHTFLGHTSTDYGEGIAADASGNIYITGTSDHSWGTPVNAHSGNWEVFAACLNSSGTLLWHTFMGSSDIDWGYGIALDSSGNTYVVGYGNATWGTPVNAHSGGEDAFAACLNSSGNLLWNTFLGSSVTDNGYGIIQDSSGQVYVTGRSGATWGSPLIAYSGGYDAFAAALDSSGDLIWNTFLGSTTDDEGFDIGMDSSGNIYVAGWSTASWGTPVNAFNGGYDIFVSCLHSSGSLLWNAFVGSAGMDYGGGIDTDGSGNIYVTGNSPLGWGTPVNAYSGGRDGFVVALSTHPQTDITANGSGGPISITESDSLKIRVSLNRWGSDENVDYWLAYHGPSGWLHYNNTTKKWESGLGVTYQGLLMDLNDKKVYQSSGLTPGNYTFYFGVDMNMDGKLTKGSLYKDEVQVTVTSN